MSVGGVGVVPNFCKSLVLWHIWPIFHRNFPENPRLWKWGGFHKFESIVPNFTVFFLGASLNFPSSDDLHRVCGGPTPAWAWLWETLQGEQLSTQRISVSLTLICVGDFMAITFKKILFGRGSFCRKCLETFSQALEWGKMSCIDVPLKENPRDCNLRSFVANSPLVQ